MTQLYTNTEDYIPADTIKDKTVLDIGCYEGAASLYCAVRGATEVVGVDAWPRQAMINMSKAKQVDIENFKGIPKGVYNVNVKYLNMDVLSERFLGLGVFDIVICAGVFYHVSNVTSFLDRLRNVTGERLYFETAVTTRYGDAPVMEFMHEEDSRFEPSCWWMPTTACILELLLNAGFSQLKILKNNILDIHKDTERVIITAVPVKKSLLKLSPTSNINDAS